MESKAGFFRGPFLPVHKNRRSQWANLLSVTFSVPLTVARLKKGFFMNSLTFHQDGCHDSQVYAVDWQQADGKPIRFRTEDGLIRNKPAIRGRIRFSL